MKNLRYKTSTIKNNKQKGRIIFLSQICLKEQPMYTSKLNSMLFDRAKRYRQFTKCNLTRMDGLRRREIIFVPHF